MVNEDVDDSFDLLLDPLLGKYKETENVLYVWEAVRVSLSADSKLPKWVLDYLLDVSRKLVSIDSPEKDAATLVKQALKLYDGRDFSRFHNKDVEIYEETIAQKSIKFSYDRGEDAFSVVGKRFGYKGETVKKVYYAMKRLEQADESIARSFFEELSDESSS